MAMSMKRQFVWTLVPAGRITPINGVPTAVCSLLLTPRLFGPVDTALRLKDFGLETGHNASAP